MGEKLLNPEDLYELDTDLPEMTGPVLLHSLDGFVDAGSTGQLVREHLLEALEHRVIARFDVDSLIDYRARRPTMTFDRDHWASYDAPELVVRSHVAVSGSLGSPLPDMVRTTAPLASVTVNCHVPGCSRPDVTTTGPPFGDRSLATFGSTRAAPNMSIWVAVRMAGSWS